MTYKLDEKHFWGNNLGYARPSVQAKTAPRVAKTEYETIKDLPNVIDHTAEEDEAFAAVNYPADDGYPTAEQIKAMADELVRRGGNKLAELTEAAQNWTYADGTLVNKTILVEQDIINTAGAKIDKDVQEGLIKGPMKFDDGKRDWSLLPYDSIEEIAKVLEFGKIKYAAWNWTEGGGFKYNRVFNASMRHLLAFMRGEDKDPDSGLSHIAHLGCNVLFLLHFILNKEKYNTCDDRRVP